MTVQKRDSRGRFKKKRKVERISDNGTKIICNALWHKGTGKWYLTKKKWARERNKK